jgi:hypothetical protein
MVADIQFKTTENLKYYICLFLQIYFYIIATVFTK